MHDVLRHAGSILRLPIVRGALRGMWWMPTGGGKVLRVLGGSYEAPQTELFMRCVRGGDVVLDVGAHIGYYTLLAARATGLGGQVFAFEPDPANAWYLRRHVRMNGCARVEIVEAAASDTSGSLSFSFGSGTGTGRIAEDGQIRIRSFRLDDFAAQESVVPAVLKIDVEGAEGAVLEGARVTLREARPLIFLSTHGDNALRTCERVLAAEDYLMSAISHGGREGWGDHICFPAERSDPGAGLSPEEAV